MVIVSRYNADSHRIDYTTIIASVASFFLLGLQQAHGAAVTAKLGE